MKDDYIIVSAYTVNTAYENEVKDLEESINKFGYEYKLYPYESKKDWVLNTMQKPKFILQALKDNPGKDVLWIDADAIIKERLSLFDDNTINCDIVLHRFQHNKHIPNEVLSGTLYIKNNDIMLKMLEEWSNMKDVNMDQRHLQYLVDKKYARKIKVGNLPETYVKIRPHKVNIENVAGVITHKQASREQRGAILLGLDNSVMEDVRKTFPMIREEATNTLLDLLKKNMSLDVILKTFKLPDASPKLRKDFLEFRQKHNISAIPLYRATSQIKTKRDIDVSQFLKDKKKILVIGNSKKLLKNNHSEFIDSFDCVIRINGGLPHENTGTKTDIWVYQFPHYEITINEAYDYYEKFSPEFVLRFALTPGTKMTAPFDNMILANISQQHSQFFKRTQPHKKRNGEIISIDSSTGAKTVDYLLNQLQVSNIHLIGFDFFKTKTFYHNNGTAPCHLASYEKKYFKALHDAKKIKVHDF